MENQGLLYNEKYNRTFRRGQKPSQGDNQQRKIFYCLDGLLGVVGIVLLGFGLLLSIKGGWSENDIHDIDMEAKTAIYMLAVFAMFTSVIGGFGAYTHWKTLIVTFSILSLMCLAFHSYIVYLIYHVQTHASRYMSIAWWDTMTDDVKIRIENANTCCGFKDIRDYAVASNVCLPDVISKYTALPLDYEEPAQVKKRDSYFKKYSSKIKSEVSAGTVTPVTGTNTGTTNAGGVAGDATAGTTGGVAGGAAGGVAGGADTGAAGGVADDGGDEAAGEAVAGAGELRRRQVGGVDDGADAGADDGADAGVADTGVAAQGGVAGGANGGVAGGAAGAAGAGGVAGGNTGAVGGAGTTGATTGAGTANGGTIGTVVNPTDLDPAKDPSVPIGCSGYLTDLVTKKVKTVYMGFMGVMIVYILGSVMGVLYWRTLRGIKEFDEFA